MEKIYFIGILLTTFIIGGIGGYYLKSSKLEFYYPSATLSEPRLQTGAACESITSSYLFANKKDNGQKIIESKAEKGTDKLSIKVNGDKMQLLTSLAVSTGVAEGAEYNIVQNNNKFLSATYLDEFGGIDTFVLNKETGKAIWSKSYSNYFIPDDVLNDSFLLNCY